MSEMLNENEICFLEKVHEADKYIDFVLTEQKPKTQVYAVRTKDGFCLGFIKWHPAWRHYCFFPESDTLHSDRCLMRIGLFVEELNKAKKEQLIKEKQIKEMKK